MYSSDKYFGKFKSDFPAYKGNKGLIIYYFGYIVFSGRMGIA